MHSERRRAQQLDREGGPSSPRRLLPNDAAQIGVEEEEGETAVVRKAVSPPDGHNRMDTSR
jgi:hypothetical protein